MGRICRIDEYERVQYKLIWNTNYPNQPESNTNYAKDFYFSDFKNAHLLIYEYYLNPAKTPDYITNASINLISARDGYVVGVFIVKDGMSEPQFRRDYEKYQYNSAKRDFDYWTSIFEKYLAD